MNKNYEVKAIQRVMLKAVDGSTTVHLEDCTFDDSVKQIHTFPTFTLNLCDSEFKNPPQGFINFIVSYLQSLVGKDVYVVHYLPLRKGMEDVDVYQGTVKNHYAISRSTLEVVASEVTTVVGDGCETKRYLMPSLEHNDNFLLDFKTS